MVYEKDQHPTAKLARIICIVVMTVATLLALFVYGFMFDSMSEGALVQLSFFWVGAIAFGAGGLILAYKGVGAAVGIGAVIALAFFLALQTFYVVLWPSL